MSAYLDLLAVTHPRPTQNSQGRRRRQQRSHQLLLQVRDAFDDLSAERLSTGSILAYLDDRYPEWRPSSSTYAIPHHEVRASFLARQLAMHGIAFHKGTYSRRNARGVWRSDVDRAISALT
jgi:hypothetical protein